MKNYGDCPICGKEILKETKGPMLDDGYFICKDCNKSILSKSRHIAFHLSRYNKDNIKSALQDVIDETNKERNEKEAQAKKEIEVERKAREKRLEKVEEINKIIVTTGDIKRDYDIIGPIYFQVSNKGLFFNTLRKLEKKYKSDLVNLKQNHMLSPHRSDWSFLYGEFSFGMSNEFDSAFFISVKELQARAHRLGADAIIWMRQDIDLDTESFQYFYLQMYGTAIKFKDKNESLKNDLKSESNLLSNGDDPNLT